MNVKTAELYDAIHVSEGFSVSTTTLHASNHREMMNRNVEAYEGVFDDDKLVLVRCVFMNPFWGDEDMAGKLIDEFGTSLEDWYRDHSKQAAQA